ncbi:MAG: hypothetical protein AAGA56_05605 [Myxococcota bacterium]
MLLVFVPGPLAGTAREAALVRDAGTARLWDLPEVVVEDGEDEGVSVGVALDR